jgi:hypothetical protein
MTNVVYPEQWQNRKRKRPRKPPQPLTSAPYQLDETVSGYRLWVHADILSPKQMIMLSEELLRTAKAAEPTLFEDTIKDRARSSPI